MHSAGVFLTVTIAIVADVVVGANIPECAYKCFQAAVNDRACDKWLSDPDCCGDASEGGFQHQVVACLLDACAGPSEKEAWTHLVEQCDIAGVNLEPYEKVFPLDPSAVISTETTASSASTSNPSTITSPSTTTITATSSSEYPLTTNPPIVPSTSTTLPGAPGALDNFSGLGGGDRLSTGGTAAIATIIPLAVFLVSFFAIRFWLQARRKKKNTPSPSAESETETGSSNPPETNLMVYEISGTEICGSDNTAELEADGNTHRDRGGPPFLRPNSTPAISISEADSGAIQNNSRQQVGELDAGAEHTVSARNQNHTGNSRIPKPTPISPPNSNPVTPITPSTYQIPPIGLSNTNTSTAKPPHQPASPIKPPPNTALAQASDIQALLSNLEAVRQRKRERASRLQMLEEEESAIQAEEQALLEEVRKRTGNAPEGGRVSTRPSAS
ncbi:hypothetical protein FQN55_001682 [Onygenales sp. PD_40]|nr:hypothetical protein FQN55_001682 [Onygenales sp. PD_40]